MDQWQGWVDYFIAHPGIAAACGAAVLLVVLLLNRKPRLEREAETRMNELRKQQRGRYDDLRPLK